MWAARASATRCGSTPQMFRRRRRSLARRARVPSESSRAFPLRDAALEAESDGGLPTDHQSTRQNGRQAGTYAPRLARAAAALRSASLALLARYTRVGGGRS